MRKEITGRANFPRTFALSEREEGIRSTSFHGFLENWKRGLTGELLARFQILKSYNSSFVNVIT